MELDMEQVWVQDLGAILVVLVCCRSFPSTIVRGLLE